ncbi:MAG: SAM-dependent methyltransferase [Hyphomonadaceae bacterium JAD_PAG50586_4]|nr:MAG: SAM-dependent methyltransferase [Hyphomonadaceae bacterium JAD_PAG50586_4]
MKAEVSAIGIVRSPRKDLSDDFWGAVEAEIDLDEGFGPEALFGLGDFSHVEILFLMHRVDAAKVETGARHPRERTDWPLVGIFGQRGKARPNRIGLTRATIVAVEGRVLRVRGLDAIDGTPVLDIKPWMDEFAPIGATRQPAWASELMRDYFKD